MQKVDTLKSETKIGKVPKRKNFKKPLVLIALVLLLLGAYLFISLPKTNLPRLFRFKEDQSSDREGETTFGENVSTSLPENFPVDFPIYPKSVIISSWVERKTDVEGLSVIWESEDKTSTLLEFYEKELKNQGWEVNTANKEDLSGTLIFKKENKEGFLGVTLGEKSKSIVSVTIGIK